MSRRRFTEETVVRIDLAKGASVALSFRGNVFDLEGPERKLIADLSATVQAYKSGGVKDRQFAEVPNG